MSFFSRAALRCFPPLLDYVYCSLYAYFVSTECYDSIVNKLRRSHVTETASKNQSLFTSSGKILGSGPGRFSHTETDSL